MIFPNNNTSNDNVANVPNLPVAGGIPIPTKPVQMPPGMFEEPNWVGRYKNMMRKKTNATRKGNKNTASRLQIEANLLYPSYKNWEASNRLQWPMKYAGSKRRSRRRGQRRVFRRVTRKF